LPGSGKSTWAQVFLARSPDIVGVSTDQIRAEIYGDEGIQGDWRQIWGQVQNRWRAALADIQTGQCGGVLYDATNVRRRSRRQLLHQARTLGFTRCIGLWFDTPLDLCLQRNQARSRHVPPDVIYRMARQLAGAPPHCREGFAALMRLM
jgi:predicted kinase